MTGPTRRGSTQPGGPSSASGRRPSSGGCGKKVRGRRAPEQTELRVVHSGIYYRPDP